MAGNLNTAGMVLYQRELMSEIQYDDEKIIYQVQLQFSHIHALVQYTGWCHF